MTELEKRVWKIIGRHVGKENVVTRKSLEVLTGASDRQVRDAIHWLTARHGKPICANRKTGGYFVAATNEELDEEIDVLVKQSVSALARVTPLKRARRFEQGNLFSEGGSHAKVA